MLNKNSVEDLKNWFTRYVQTFKYNDKELQQNIDLKKDHTGRVCKEILNLGEQLGLDDDALRLAEIIALLHDIGRFEQYARYKTFMDGKSENHAELGIKILKKHGVLTPFDDTTRDVILRSIQYHNRPSLPHGETETCLLFTKLLRDADKLDIWKVVTDYYHREDGKRNAALEFDLPDTPGFSEEVYRDLMNKTIVDIKHIKNLNDIKLLQIGWIFDINFKPTLSHIKNRRYLELIRDVLPKSKEIEEIFDIIHFAFVT
ncbi:MAG: HD domain-containing protein [Deltaproteobacteria bacterium]|nr:HD domain-containing protein [Deltaproteobacteria bacterium]